MVRNAEWFDDDNAAESAGGRRPTLCDLLPWADPYIAALVASLEREQLLDSPDFDTLA